MAPSEGASAAAPRAELGTAWAFRTLGLSRDTTRAEAKRAYHRVLKSAHPDKGGDAERFLQVQQALQAVLQDLERATAREWDWRQGRDKPQAAAADTTRDGDGAAAAATSSEEDKSGGAQHAAVDPGPSAAAAAARGGAAWDAGDVAGACAAWTEALVWTPGDAALLCRRSEGVLRLGRPADALADARAAAALRPRAAAPHVCAGVALSALAQPRDAAAAFRRALELDPSSQEAARLLAEAEREAAASACLGVLTGHSAAVSVLLAAPARADSTTFVLASASLDGTLRLWDASGAESTRAQSVAACADGVVWAAWAPDGAALATAGADGAARLWRVDAADPLAAPPEASHVLQGHTLRVTCGAFTPDGTRLVTGGADCCARVWRTSDGSCEHALLGHAKFLTCLAMSPNGALVATGSGDGTVRVYDVACGELWDEIDCADSGAVTQAAWAPRAAPARPLLLTGHANTEQNTSRILIWDFQAAERTRPLQQYARAFPKKTAFSGRVHALQAIRIEHRTLAVYAAGNGMVSVFEPATGQVHFTLRDTHAAQPPAGSAPSRAAIAATATAAALSPCGRLLATAGVDNAVKVWDVSEGELLCVLVGPAAPPRCLAWSHDSAALAAAGSDATPRVWAAPPAPPDA